MSAMTESQVVLRPGFLSSSRWVVRLTAVLSFVVATMSIAGVAHAATATIYPSQDVTLYQSSFDQVANGAGGYLFVGRIASGERRRALLRFANLSAIPPGSTIDNVSLHFQIDRTVSGAVQFNLNRMLTSWGEGSSDAGPPGGSGTGATTDDATWIHRFYPSTLWSNAGGDFDSVNSATLLVDIEADYTVASSAAMVSDVQSWLDNPTTNFGWMLRANETSSPPTAKRLGSREASNAAARPYIVVQFTAPPALPVPGLSGIMQAFLMMALVLIAMAWRQHQAD